MTVIKVIAFIIFIIACIAIYHNTNSYEPKKRILFIVVGMVLMYGITSLMCTTNLNGIQIKNGQAVEDTVSVMKWIFTPINALISLCSIGNTLGKAKDQEITTDKAGKRLVIIAIALIIIFIFESSYIKNFITTLLG